MICERLSPIEQISVSAPGAILLPGGPRGPFPRLSTCCPYTRPNINQVFPGQRGAYGLYKAEEWLFITASSDFRANLIEHWAQRPGRQIAVCSVMVIKRGDKRMRLHWEYPEGQERRF